MFRHNLSNDSFKWSLTTWALSERYVDSFVNNSYEYLANFSHYPLDNATDWPTNSWFDKMNFDNTELPCYREANKVHLLPCCTLPPTIIITYAVKFVSKCNQAVLRDQTVVSREYFFSQIGNVCLAWDDTSVKHGALPSTTEHFATR